MNRRHIMNRVVHFEMPFDDRDRIVTFYESAFGWHTQKLGEDMGNYSFTGTSTFESRIVRQVARQAYERLRRRGPDAKEISPADVVPSGESDGHFAPMDDWSNS
jgi:bleomycin resistance family protein